MLARTELLRREKLAQRFVARALRALTLGLGGALTGLVGVVALSAGAVAALEQLGVSRAPALCAVGLAALFVATLLARAARAAYAAPQREDSSHDFTRNPTPARLPPAQH